MASDFLLEIEGIKGESKDSKHPATIEVLSWSWGVSNAGSAAVGSGMGSGKASFQDISFAHYMDKASTALVQHCASGNHITKATLFGRKQGGKTEGQVDFMKITLTDLIVSSVSTGGSEGSGVPVENVSLNYAKIKIEYAVQKEKGGLDAYSEANWSLKENKA